MQEAFERLLSLLPKNGSAHAAIAAAGVEAGGDVLAERRDEMLSALEEHRLWNEKQALLEKAKSMEGAGFERWESFFVQAVSLVPWAWVMRL